MTKYQLRFLPSATRDLNEIYERVSDSLGTYWANIVLSRIIKDIYKLQIFPTGYNTIPEMPEFRRKKSKKYLIIFQVIKKDKTVIIVDIFYGRRNYLPLISN
ncbi:type II toxin-antitoxin system RelE/ParE family toxin [Candidatus Saccharibacteria bacterium]|nr:type II toxin-antitoxin system RelE/ParE family toxin [Candidatus Saccharibacteria bacterium]